VTGQSSRVELVSQISSALAERLGRDPGLVAGQVGRLQELDDLPRRMIEDGFPYNGSGSLGTAAMAFMREHGVPIDVYKETDEGNHRTAPGKRMSVHTKKGRGFGPKGIARFVLPYTTFLKLKEIGGNILPPYEEHLQEVAMTAEMAERYALPRKLIAQFAPLSHHVISLKPGDSRSGIGESRIPD
jgi:hypothetical protein